MPNHKEEAVQHFLIYIFVCIRCKVFVMPSFENNITWNVGILGLHYYCENLNFSPNKMLKLRPWSSVYKGHYLAFECYWNATMWDQQMRFLVAHGVHKFVVSLLYTIGRVIIVEMIPFKGSPQFNGHKYESQVYVWENIWWHWAYMQSA